uniref:Protein kinase domain-containing protein n=1 Tax=Vitrella brassicaformis TaxID=1169539 RepID=A0A6U4CL23_9ALVE
MGEGGFSPCREAILRNPRAIVGEAKIRRAVKITQISETAIEEDEAATAEEKKNRKSLNPYLRYIKGRQRRQSKMTPEEIHREVYLLKLAQHPNIVLVHDVFLYDASCYIVMERYDADLESVDCLFWPASKVTEATAHILLAVHHLHSLNICHRDIKPQNFFVTNEGRLVLSDFGLAVETECEHAGLSDTSGSLPYLAPEVLAGDYGRKADMWSVGVTLFWIITGFTPFTGFEDHDVARAILKGQYSTKACRHAPKECRDLIKKLLEPNPKRRLTAADALRHPYVVPALDNIPWAAQQLSTDFYQNHKKFSKDYRTHRDEKSHQSPSDEATNKSKGDSKEGHKEKDGQKEGQAQNYKTGYRMTDTYYRHPLLRSPFAGASFDIHDYLDDDTGTSALLSNGPREVVY